eukprot:2198889-Pleurochrysis_carterae.AAC.2
MSRALHDESSYAALIEVITRSSSGADTSLDNVGEGDTRRGLGRDFKQDACTLKLARSDYRLCKASR